MSDSFVGNEIRTGVLSWTDLFDVFSIALAGQFPNKKEGTSFLVIAVENLTIWPILKTTKTATAAKVITFVRE